ncbi:MAG: hypothetical protein Q8K82_12160 [Gemmatimonadaceae bacterium]|nr:hypothetical protein [Gemmatimonadaceae bacterium]
MVGAPKRAAAALRRIGLVCTTAAGIFGCSGERVLVPSANNPFLFLVLSEQDRIAAGDSAIRAILMHSGDPSAARYTAARTLEMSRVGGNVPFAWREISSPRVPPASYRGLALSTAGNYVLGAPTPDGRLGRSALVAGAEYALRITLDDRVVLGRTRIPARVALRIDEVGGRRRVSWSPVRGVPLYVVDSETELVAVAISDTLYILREDAVVPRDSSSSRLRVAALDSNLAKYWNDSTISRSGISSGYGVFGSYAVRDTALPPRAR